MRGSGQFEDPLEILGIEVTSMIQLKNRQARVVRQICMVLAVSRANGEACVALLRLPPSLT